IDFINSNNHFANSLTQSVSYSSDMEILLDNYDTTALITPGMPGVAITFNGWAIDEWYNIRGLLNYYGARVTFFVGNINDLNSSDFEKLRTLKNAGHEVATSGFRYVNAIDFVRNYSLQTYIDTEITPAIDLMSENDLFPTSYAYPFGSRNSTIDSELLKYFLRLRSTAYTSNTTRIVDLDQVYYKWENEALIRGVGIDSEYGNTIEEIIEGLERAQQSNEVLVLYGHTPTYDTPDYGTPVEKLISILEAAQMLNLELYRVSDLAVDLSSTTTSPINNETNTNGIIGINDILISIVLASAGVGILWVLASLIFPNKQK
ncbi:MAG: polysaccharide deacetylase family protein, partial [Candidatus Sifarchaeia archaeon]